MSTVSTGQTYIVASGQTDMTDIVLSNGLDVLTGGTLGNTIVSGGAIIGSGIDTTINSGGDKAIDTTDTATGTIVYGGGFEDVLSEANASGTSIEGGTVEVASSGSIESSLGRVELVENPIVPFTIIVRTAYGQMIVNRHDITETNFLFKKGFSLVHSEIVFLTNVLRLCGNNLTVVDVGANVGTHALAFARVAGPQGTVHAFEPQRIIFNMLCGSVALNSITNLYCYNMAVGDRQESIEIPQFDYTQPLNFGSIEFGPTQCEVLSQPRRHDPNRVEFVPLTTLDHFAFKRVDLMKIDAEGMELQVLDGAAETIRRCQPVLYVEFVKVDADALRQRIVASGDYSVYKNKSNYLCVPSRLSDQLRALRESYRRVQYRL
jgi:FkbM family methyltransferase